MCYDVDCFEKNLIFAKYIFHRKRKIITIAVIQLLLKEN